MIVFQAKVIDAFSRQIIKRKMPGTPNWFAIKVNADSKVLIHS